MTPYSEMYLSDAMETLGAMADFSDNELGFDLNEFWSYFATSRFATAIECGSALCISGMSGSDLALRVCEEVGLEHLFDSSRLSPLSSSSVCCFPGCSYWCGWIVAYYQWVSGRSFREIFAYVNMNQVADFYPAGHESPRDWFVERVESHISSLQTQTRLKKQRDIVGLSQSQLAKRSGVSLRAIQQFEQRQKNINRASFDKIIRLSQALYCRAEDLYEPEERFEYGLISL